MSKKRIGGCLAASMLAAAILFPAFAGDMGGEVLGNADIIGLARAGMAPELIVAKIVSSSNTFDLSTRAMIAMKENGVQDQVIGAMLAAAQTSSARSTLDQQRFAAELENIAIGDESSRSAGIAWMLSNREAAIPELQKSLAGNRGEIRAASVRSLAGLRDQASLPAMRNLLTDASPQVRQATAEALATMQDGPSIYAAEQAVARQLNPLDGYVRLVGYARLTQSAAALGAVLSSNPDALNRAAAAWALGEIGRPGIAGRPALESALIADVDAGVRREAVVALAKYHDATSAAMLQNACRTDPAVRKVALEAMSEYPETIEFLIGVMSLGPDQIAADELETARASLSRLTGQDLGMDGNRWSEWFAANRSRFSTSTTLAGTGTGLPAGALSGYLEGSAISGTGLSGSRAGEVDLEAWSLLADPGDIPMAPEVDRAMPRAPAPNFMAGALPPPPGGAARSSSPGFPASSPMDFPSTLSPDDFGGNDDIGGAGLAGSGSSGLFRTWSSEPDKPIPSATDRLSTASSSPFSGGVDEDMFMSGMDAESLPMDPDIGEYREVSSLLGEDGLFGPEPSTETIFEAPSFAGTLAQPVETAPAVPDEPPGGIALPLPGMQSASAAPVAIPSASSLRPPTTEELFAAPVPDDLMSDPYAWPESGQSSTRSDGRTSLSPDQDLSGQLLSDDLFSQPDISADSGMPPAFWGNADTAQSNDDMLFGSDPAFPATSADSGLVDGNAWHDESFQPAASVGDTNALAMPPTDMMPASPADPSGFPLAEEAVPGDLAIQPGVMDEASDIANANAGVDVDDGEEEVKSYAQYLFVEPEPGQVVVGEPLFDGIPAKTVPSMNAAATVPSASPSAPRAVGQLESAQGEESDEYFVPRHAPAGSPMVDTRYITIPGAEQESGGSGGRRRGRGNAESTSSIEEVYRPFASQTYEPPAPPTPAARPGQESATPAPSPRGDAFTDPSVPLPPVNPQGTVKPGADGTLPLLGEGMF